MRRGLPDAPVGAVREPPTTRACATLRAIQEIGVRTCLCEVTSGLISFELFFETLGDAIGCCADIAVKPRLVDIHPAQFLA